MATPVLKNANIQKPRLKRLTRWLSNWFSWLKNLLNICSSSGGDALRAKVQGVGLQFRGRSGFMHGKSHNDFGGSGVMHGGDHTNDLDIPSINFDDIDLDELEWTDSDVESSRAIQPTLQDSQNENNTVLESFEAENNINYNAVDQNNIMIQEVPQIESYISNKSCEVNDNIWQGPTCISSDTTLNRVDNRRTSKINIPFEVLQSHFNMSMRDAAKNLGVNESTLKRRCREYGVKRWPNSCKRKNINHEESPNPNKVNKIVHNKNNDDKNLTIKAIYGDDIVKFPFSISSGLDDLKEKVNKWLNIDIQIKLKYKDDDGDLVLIACDDALREIFGRRLSRLADQNSAFEFSVFRHTISDV